MNLGLPGHITRATYLTVMFVSFVIHYFIPNNFGLNNDKFISNFSGMDTILEISVVYRKLLCTLYEDKINQCI